MCRLISFFMNDIFYSSISPNLFSKCPVSHFFAPKYFFSLYIIFTQVSHVPISLKGGLAKACFVKLCKPKGDFPSESVRKYWRAKRGEGGLGREWVHGSSPPGHALLNSLAISASENFTGEPVRRLIQTGLFGTFSDRGGGGCNWEAPLCNFKTSNAMVTKLMQDDVDNNSSHFRCSVDMVT